MPGTSPGFGKWPTSDWEGLLASALSLLDTLEENPDWTFCGGPWQFQDRTILIDTPWETAIKKIFYRPSTFKIRDIFDLAAVIDHDHEKLRSSLVEVEDRVDKLTDRIDALVPVYETAVAEDIHPTESGRKYMSKSAILRVQDFLGSWFKEKHP
jgi:hypothetical protein